jgi:hypothetical protein
VKDSTSANLSFLRLGSANFRETLVLFRRRARGELSEAEQRMGARVRKSRQKEAGGAADAGLMQIEWSEGGVVLKLAGVGTEAEEGAREGVEARIDGRKRWARGREVGIGAGAGRARAERGEPCRVFELWASRFMRQ